MTVTKGGRRFSFTSLVLVKDEEKRAVNIKPLCKNLSVMFFLAALIFGIAGLSELFRASYFKWFMVGWIVLCCADIVFINKSGLYVKKT